MPRNYKPRGLRAPKGSLGARLLLQLSPELKASATKAAKASGIRVAEFIRRAIEAAVKRAGSGGGADE